ncbi:hypothetical protein AMTRI_Chr07g31120 [Amborella trichopoda]
MEFSVSLLWNSVRKRRVRARVLEEQRVRLYIIRRCLIMLLCWRDSRD